MHIWTDATKYLIKEDLLSYMHQPIQPKSLSWWGEVGNSLIFQHSPSRGDSLRPQTWNRSKQQLFYLIALTRIRTQDLWLWYHIELHAPTNSTQKLKLIGRGGQFTYIAIGLIITLNLKIYNEREYKDTTKSFSVTKTYLNYNQERNLKIPCLQKKNLALCNGGGVIFFLSPLRKKKETREHTIQLVRTHLVTTIRTNGIKWHPSSPNTKRMVKVEAQGKWATYMAHTLSLEFQKWKK